MVFYHIVSCKHIVKGLLYFTRQNVGKKSQSSHIHTDNWNLAITNPACCTKKCSITTKGYHIVGIIEINRFYEHISMITFHILLYPLNIWGNLDTLAFIAKNSKYQFTFRHNSVLLQFLLLFLQI